MAGSLKRGGLSALLVAVVLSVFGTAFAGVDKVICVPWQGDPLKPHTAVSGSAAKLKCVIKATNTASLYYKWIFGDGTESAVATLSGLTKYNVETTHAYSGVAGTPFTARILVDPIDSSMTHALTDTYLLKIEENTLDARVNIGIDQGLWYLYKSANTDSYARGGSLHTLNNSPFMAWYQGGYGPFWASPTASAIQAFAINNHKITGNPNEDPYVEAVQLAVNWLVHGYYSSTSYPMLQVVSIGSQHNDNPEAGQSAPNGIGIQVRDYGSRSIYQGGQVMDAIVASGVQPDESTGRDFTGRGSPWTFRELLQDMCDMYAYGQYDGTSSNLILGGWRYNWGEWPDNSACQWAAIGMIAAQQPPWNCIVAPWVKTYNANWLTYSYQQWNSNLWGGFGYTGSGNGWGTSPSGLVQMDFAGQIGYDDPTTPQEERDPKWVRTERYFADNWASFLSSNYLYGWYAFAKAMRLAVPQQVERLTSNNLDWYKGSGTTKGLAQRILELQNSDGSWPSAVYCEPPLNTAWMIITLRPALFKAAPIACFTAHPTPNYADKPIFFDPSCSGHSETGKDIGNLISFEWDWNNDGIYDTATATPEEVSHAFSCATLPCTYPVTLRVTDDGVPALSASFKLDITISNPPHPPVAHAGGPYRVSLCSDDSLRLDGSLSFDPDEGEHQTGCSTCPGDTLTSWKWDLKEPLTDFTDQTGKIVVIPSSGGVLGSYFGAGGPCTVGLKVEDNTRLAYPGSGLENLSDVNFEAVQVDPCCNPDLALTTQITPRGGVQLNWTLTGAASFDIYRSKDATANTGYTLIKHGCLPEQMPYIDSSSELRFGTTYRYRVVASDGCGSSPVTATPGCSIGDLSALNEPGRKVLLSWGALCDANGGCSQSYAVLRSVANPPNPATDQVGSAGGALYEDSGLSSGVTYYYQVVSAEGCRSNVVSIVGNTAPSADAGADQVLEQENGAGTLAMLDASGSSDPDGDSLTYAWTGEFGSVSGVRPTVSLPLGTHTITLTVSDGSLEASDTVTVTIRDTTSPRISAPADLILEQSGRSGTPVGLGSPLVSDICDANPAVTNNAPALFPAGETLVTWTARDASGNSATAVQKVTILDTIAPQILPPADLTVEQETRDGTSVALGSPAVLDVADPNPAVTSDAPAVFPLGETLVTWTARDASGNSASAVQKVTVIDTTPPEIDPPPDIVVEKASGAGNAVDLGTPEVSDICDANPIVTNNAPALFMPGETRVTWTVRDASGNLSTAVQKVSVVDSTPCQKFIRTTGKPNVYRMTFAATSSSAKIVLFNGDADGSNRVSSAVIKLNGVEIFDPNDFNPHVYELGRTVSVSAQNELLVELRSKPGSYLSLCVDEVSPDADRAPVADAGADQKAVAGQPVQLDGSQSTDLDGDALTYRWTLTVPSGSAAALSDPSSVNPTFTVDREGTYLAELTVSDGTLQSRPDAVVISTENAAPVAKAGPDQTAFITQTVRLNGSKSSDADGDPLSYGWSLVSAPEGSGASLADASSVSPTFVADRHGTYVVELIVSDGKTQSAPDRVEISTLNSRPVAIAGPDQTAYVGKTVTLNGAGSSDADGDRLTYRWSIVSKPAGSTAALSDGSALSPVFSLDLFGTYVVQLVVNDGTSESAPDTVVVSTLNSPPVAHAGADQTRHVGESAQLDGSGSTDVDGNTLLFKWSLASKPAGSAAALSDPSSVKPSFEIDLPGIYVAQLIVNDGTVDSPPDTVSIVTENSAPVAHAGPDQTVFVGEIATLDGSKATDIDGDTLTYQWAILSAPAGSTAALNGVGLVNPVFRPDLPGSYVIQLIVSDGILSSDPDTIVVSTKNSPPVAHAGPDQTLHVGETAQLDGSGSTDVDGDALKYTWALTSKPEGSEAAFLDPSAVNPSFEIDRPGTYIAQLIVSDGTVDSVPDTVSIVTENSAPVADAGPDQTAHLTDTVTLDGSKSIDIDGDLLTFTWSFVSKPPGSTAVLSDPATVRPTFVVDVHGTYVIQLIMNDGKLSSAPDTVKVLTENAPPVAEAGPDQTVYVGSLVTLDGSKSSDVDGDTLTYQWALTAKPEGSTVTLSGPATAHPTFTPDLPGTYVAQLIVRDGTVSSDPDTVKISTQNSAPIANAGADLTGHVGEIALLDGSKSSDVDGDPLRFKWSLTSKPAGSEAVLDDPSAVRPSFTIDKPGTYIAQLIVNDGTVDSAADTATIVTLNSRPVSEAGPDQSVHVTDTVTLDGSKSSDVDGDLLTYQWSFSSKPSGSTAVLSDPAAVRPTFEVDLPGTYILQLVVNDGKLASDPDTVTIVTENSKPVANAGADQTVFVGNAVTLDGSLSKDVDGDALTYQWALTARPEGSSAVLSGATSVHPTFFVDRPGTYVAQLVVKDGKLSSDPDTIVVSTENSRPVARAGADQTVHIGDTVTLDGSASSDADFDPLSYQWALTSVPPGSVAVIPDPTAVTFTFVADVAGIYVVQLIVHDGKLASLPDTVVITTGNRKPLAEAGPDQTVSQGQTVHLSGSASSDPDGDPLLFSWSFGSKPAGSNAVLTGADTASPSFTADKVGMYMVRLTVSDGLLASSPDTVTVTCTGPAVTAPNLAGMTLEEAQAALTAAGLVLGTLSSRESQTVPVDHVISQSPAAGSSVAQGSAVNLTISLGTTGPMLLSIGVAPPDLTLAGGESGQFTAMGTYSDGSTRTVTAEAVWSMGNPAIAQVSSTGRVTALASGQTSVTAAIDTVSGSAVLTVTPPHEVSMIVAPQNPILLVGQSQTFTALVLLTDGTSQGIASGVTWTSSDSSVASISESGEVVALAEGTAVISGSKDAMTGSSTLTVYATLPDTVSPTALITSPANRSILTGPVPIIGTAGDENFLKYVLEIAPTGQTAFVQMGAGASAVTDGVLGTFDPTLLPNGFYTIRLTVFDRGGNTTTAQISCLVAARGLAWLNANQNQDGSWGSDASLTDFLPETLEVEEALKALGQTGFASYAGGAAWVQSQPLQVTDYLSRKMRALSATADEMASLLALRDAETGAWGGAAGYGPNNLDTALALQALSANAYGDAAVLGAALSYLVAHQNSDGGWGLTTEDASSVTMTAIVSTTLQQFSPTPETVAAVSKATSWLAARQNGDGGLGDGASTAYETALAFSALAGATGDSALLGRAVNYLVASQLADGSWSTDPYCTGLALKVMVRVLSM